MPARSKSQQRLFGMLHAYNKGELQGSKALKKRMSEMSKHISDEDARHFAETPHKGLPEKKAKMNKPIPKKLKDDENDRLKYLAFSEVALQALGQLAGKQEKKASRQVYDIAKIYEDVRRAYRDLGYSVSGDKLKISNQPTYSNGKPVPTEIMRSNESGGNVQDDGTVVINPEYRKVMRHWKLKGSGLDFLRTIIGHELGHHVDRTLLRTDSKEIDRNKLLDTIRRRKFHTIYTDSYGPNTDPRKLDKELIAEYLAQKVVETIKNRK